MGFPLQTRFNHNRLTFTSPARCSVIWPVIIMPCCVAWELAAFFYAVHVVWRRSWLPFCAVPLSCGKVPVPPWTPHVVGNLIWPVIIMPAMMMIH